MTEKTFTLWVHNEASPELVINPAKLPNVKGGDILELRDPKNASGDTLLLAVGKLDSSVASLEISVAKHVADIFHFVSRTAVRVRPVPRDAVEIESLECVFKQQYISRSDMWHLKMATNSCVYEQQRLSYSGIKAQVRTIRINGEPALSGLVTANTKWTFRSMSAAFFVLVQISREMWEFTPNGDMYWETCVNGFLKDMFDSWQREGASHALTLIMFCRVFYEGVLPLGSDLRKDTFTRGADGRLYQDFYQVLFYNERGISFEEVQRRYKEHFHRLPVLANFQCPIQGVPLDEHAVPRSPATPATPGSTTNFVTQPRGVLSSAQQGNVLEVINLGLNVFDQHNVDRDLMRCGQSLLLVSAGTGVFDVDLALASLTKARMIDGGIGSDILCLGDPPLHTVPLFLYKMRPTNRHAKEKGIGSALEAFEDAPPAEDRIALAQPMFNVPFWLHCSFYKWSTDKNVPNKYPFQRRCRNIGDSKVGSKAFVPVRPPVGDFGEAEDAHTLSAGCKAKKMHDEHVFTFDDERGSAPNLSRRTVRVGSLPKGFDSQESLDLESPISPRSAGSSGQSWQRINVAASARDSPSTANSPQSLPRSLDNLDTSLRVSPFPSGSMRSFASQRMSSSIRRRGRRKGDDEVTQIRNPFKTSMNILRLGNKGESSDLRRWGHVFQTNSLSDTPSYATFTHTGPWWPSLLRPACLPLTTDFFPDPTELDIKYFKKPCTLAPNPDSGYHDKIETSLKELIAQRLAQGFQLVVKQELKHSAQTMAGRPGVSYFMSVGENFHVLVYQPGEENIQITQYALKPTDEARTALSFLYTYQLMHMEETFRTMQVRISHIQPRLYDWFSQDELVCGYTDDEEDLDGLKWWRIGFAILPIAVPTDAPGTKGLEERSKITANFSKLIDAIARTDDGEAFKINFATPQKKEANKSPAKLSSSTELADQRGGSTSTWGATDMLAVSPPLQPAGPPLEKLFHYRQTAPGLPCETDLNYNQFMAVLSRASTSKDSNVSKTLEGCLAMVAALMCSSDSGLSLKTRGVFRKSKNCFQGGDAVNWLLDQLKLTSREGALKLAVMLLSTGKIRGLSKNTPFQERSLYQFSADADDDDVSFSPPVHIDKPMSHALDPRMTKPQAQRSPVSSTYIDRGGAMPDVLKHNIKRAAWMPPVTDHRPRRAPPSYGVRKIVLSRKDREEFLNVRYDRDFSPSSVYHLELRWLVCTGPAVASFVKTCERKATQLGLHFHRVPVQLEKGMRTPPLVRSHMIELNIARAQRDDAKLQKHLIRRFDFVPDKSLPSGYLHRLGHATVRVVPGGFLWMPNFAITGSRAESRALLKAFTKACTSRTYLNEVLHPEQKTKDKYSNQNGLASLFYHSLLRDADFSGAV